MEIPDIEHLMRTAGIDEANRALQAGWKLVAVVATAGANGVSYPTYIFGWPTGKPGRPEPEKPASLSKML